MPYGFYDDRARYDLGDIANLVKQQVLNNLYPPGSVYITTKSRAEFDPNNEFAGTWELIEDRFLYAVGENEATGQEGGNTDGGKITLSDNQVPLRRHNHEKGTLTHAHTHEEGADTLVRPYYLGGTGVYTRVTYVSSDGINRSLVSSFTRQSQPSKEIATSGSHKGEAGSGYDGRAIIFNSLRRKSNAANSAKVPVTTTQPNSSYLSGGSTEYKSLEATEQVDIMPPYITVHIWKRTDNGDSFDLLSDSEETTQGE